MLIQVWFAKLSNLAAGIQIFLWQNKPNFTIFQFYATFHLKVAQYN